MAIYLGYALGKEAPVRTGSLDEVLVWGRDELIKRDVIKVARARSERASVKVIADLTREGFTFAKAPRVLSLRESKKLCRKARER